MEVVRVKMTVRERKAHDRRDGEKRLAKRRKKSLPVPNVHKSPLDEFVVVQGQTLPGFVFPIDIAKIHSRVSSPWPPGFRALLQFVRALANRRTQIRQRKRVRLA
jgi:hypothetical protein